MIKFEDCKFMSIGSYCLSIYILGNNRIAGPIDNVLIENSRSIELLLDNKYFNYLTNTNFIKIPKKYTENEEANFDFYFSNVVKIVHNDIEKPKYFINLKERINNFNAFIKSIKDKNKFLVFTISYLFTDYKNGEVLNNSLESIIKYFKSKNILDKVIFVGCKKNKSIKKQPWWNNYLNEKIVQKWKQQYQINYIELTDTDLATLPGKQAANVQFKQKFNKLLADKETKIKSQQKQKIKKQKTETTYLGGGGYFGL